MPFLGPWLYKSFILKEEKGYIQARKKITTSKYPMRSQAAHTARAALVVKIFDFKRWEYPLLVVSIPSFFLCFLYPLKVKAAKRKEQLAFCIPYRRF